MAYTTGFAYKRWKRGVDVQLLKEDDNYNPLKLCTILLLEADFNMNNKAQGQFPLHHVGTDLSKLCDIQIIV